MLRFVLLVIAVYLALRLLRRILLRPRNPGAFRPRQAPTRPGPSPSGPPKVIDEMKPCPACGTFNPTRLAYEKKGLYFCEKRCHEAYIRGEKQA